MVVSINGGTPWIFPCKPSILGYPPFMENPNISQCEKHFRSISATCIMSHGILLLQGEMGKCRIWFRSSVMPVSGAQARLLSKTNTGTFAAQWMVSDYNLLGTQTHHRHSPVFVSLCYLSIPSYLSMELPTAVLDLVMRLISSGTFPAAS